MVIIDEKASFTSKLVLTENEIKEVYSGFLEKSNSRQIFPVLNDISDIYGQNEKLNQIAFT